MFLCKGFTDPFPRRWVTLVEQPYGESNSVREIESLAS